MVTYYLNTDLLLVAGARPDALLRALDPDGVVHCEAGAGGAWHVGPFNAPLSGEPSRTPEQDIADLLDPIDRLEGAAADEWVACDRRELNIGWQAGERRPEGAFELPVEVLARVVAHGVHLGVTIYPSCEADPDQAATLSS